MRKGNIMSLKINNGKISYKGNGISFNNKGISYNKSGISLTTSTKNLKYLIIAFPIIAIILLIVGAMSLAGLVFTISNIHFILFTLVFMIVLFLYAKLSHNFIKINSLLVGAVSGILFVGMIMYLPMFSDWSKLGTLLLIVPYMLAGIFWVFLFKEVMKRI